MSVVVNEFEVVTAPTAVQPASGPAPSTPPPPPPGPWAALEVAESQRRLAERAARLAAT